jgi:tryptophan 2,3-dioxygenase
MAGPQNFLDNLENLRLVMSVALEHVQENRDQFVKSGTAEQARKAERSISRIRSIAEQLEKEFNALETLMIQQRRPLV